MERSCPGITFAEKSELMTPGHRQEETETCLVFPDYRDRFAGLLFQRNGNSFSIEFRDEGAAQDWEGYLAFDERLS